MGTPSREKRLLPEPPPLTYIAVVPSAPVVTPGRLCAQRIGSPSPMGETTLRIPASPVSKRPRLTISPLVSVLTAAWRVSRQATGWAEASRKVHIARIVSRILRVIMFPLTKAIAHQDNSTQTLCDRFRHPHIHILPTIDNTGNTFPRKYPPLRRYW